MIYTQVDDFSLEDYSDLIVQFVKANNVDAVFGMCSAQYHFDRGFAWYEPLMKAAVQPEVDLQMFALVYYMWNFFYEERDDTSSLDELKIHAGCEISSDKMELIDPIVSLCGHPCVKQMKAECPEDQDDDDFYEEFRSKVKSFLEVELKKLRVDLKALRSKFKIAAKDPKSRGG
ncbi:Hypothetical protein POVR1_LOCUS548 [uncultured virus]|nr:Hypothetical protein POVR1_LOCUS548 [uncultured virus]